MLYQFALASFANAQGLAPEGGNLYSETAISGQAVVGAPGESGKGGVYANTLEMANVDLAEEFVKMITTQRGFQANSRTISTSDDMLNEVVNLKR